MLCTALTRLSTIACLISPRMQQIARAGEAEQTINKSRFIARVLHCEDERAVAQFLRGFAAENSQAHHLAFAFRILQGRSVVERSSDAGEPAGTAGMPILQHLTGRDLVNCCIGVIRYYGGINLGTGGLVRAYGGTARLALDACTLAPYVEMQSVQLTLDYHRLDHFIRDLDKIGGAVIDRQFSETVTVTFHAPAAEIPALIGRYQK